MFQAKYFSKINRKIYIIGVLLLVLLTNGCNNDEPEPEPTQPLPTLFPTAALPILSSNEPINEISPISSTQIPEVQEIVNPTPVPDNLKDFIIGPWKWLRNDGAYNDGSYMVLDFIDDKTLVTNGMKFSYEFIDDNAMLLSPFGVVLNVYDFHDNILPIEVEGQEMTFDRVEVIPDLADAILGLWILEEDGIANGVIEFAPDHKVVYGGLPGDYRVLGSNSIEMNIFEFESHQFPQIIEVTNSTLTFAEEDDSFTATRVEDSYPNLASQLVGSWHTEDDSGVFYGPATIKFTADYRFSLNDYDTNYSVISNNTFVVYVSGDDNLYYNVVDLTDDTFTLAEFGNAYVARDDGTYHRVSFFTRIHP